MTQGHAANSKFVTVINGSFRTIHKKNSESVPVILLDAVLAHPSLSHFISWFLNSHRGQQSSHTGSKGGSNSKQAGDITVSVKSTRNQEHRSRNEGS
jgi:hypothetical protein